MCVRELSNTRQASGPGTRRCARAGPRGRDRPISAGSSGRSSMCCGERMLAMDSWSAQRGGLGLVLMLVGQDRRESGSAI